MLLPSQINNNRASVHCGQNSSNRRTAFDDDRGGRLSCQLQLLAMRAARSSGAHNLPVDVDRMASTVVHRRSLQARLSLRCYFTDATPIDLVIANAGVAPITLNVERDVQSDIAASTRLVFDVNVTGVLLLRICDACSLRIRCACFAAVSQSCGWGRAW